MKGADALKVTIAAAAPDILPGRPGQNMTNVLAAITRARDDGASILVLPANLPEEMNRGAIDRQAGKMTVYPLMKPSLRADQLMHCQEGKILCCSADTPATVFSHFSNLNLASLASHEHMSVVAMACPMGGDGSTLYTGQCILAQNGAILASADGYIVKQVSIPSREKKSPLGENDISQPTNPWSPFPEELPVILKLQTDALARRMMYLGATQLSVSIDRTASSLLALAACVQAVDKLKLSRKNIHVTPTGNRCMQIAAAWGVTYGGHAGLTVDTTDLTTRVLAGTIPEGYAINGTIPRSVARLVMRHYANTCGNIRLSTPIRSICLDDNASHWGLYDFLLYYSLLYDLPKWTQARLLEDTFIHQYPLEEIQQVLDRFFDVYHRPAAFDGPSVFSLEVHPPHDLQ